MNAEDIQWIRTPFSSLRDESVLLELHSSLQGSVVSSRQQGTTPTPTSTSVNGVTMSFEEMNQDADIARLLLFAKHPIDESSDTIKRTKKRKSANGGVNVASLVLKEPSLVSASPEVQIITERQEKKGAIIERMFQAIDKCKGSRLHETQSSQHNGSIDFPSTKIIEEEGETTPLKLFSLATCRMQLRMLKSLGPEIQMGCLLDMVDTILDFPQMALANTKQKSSEDATINALYSFGKCYDRESLVIDDKMLITLALGVSSGRIRYLLDVARNLARQPKDFHIHPRCESQFKQLLDRMRSYQSPSPLGILDDDHVIHSIRFKLDADGSRKTSLTTDGTYLYLWSNTSGLKKVGTGNGGTVSGRIYGKTAASNLLQYFSSKRPVLLAICGTFEHISDIHEFDQTQSVEERFGTGQLLVVYRSDGTIHHLQLESLDRIILPPNAMIEYVVFGSFVDVTTSVQQAEAHAVYSDDISALSGAKLLMLLSPLRGETRLKHILLRKGERLFKPQEITSSSILHAHGYLYLNVSPSQEMEFLRINTNDLQVKEILPCYDYSSDSIRLEWITEGDYFYDIRLHDGQTIGVHVYDEKAFLRSMLFPQLKYTGLNHFYTNGQVLAMVSTTHPMTQINLSNGILVANPNPKSSTSSSTAFDPYSNVLWTIVPSKNCIDCHRQTGSWIYIREKSSPGTPLIHPDAALNYATTIQEPGLKSLMIIMAKMHEIATTQIKLTAPATTPLAIDVSEESFQVLIEFVCVYGHRFCQLEVLDPWEHYLLMASLVLLTVNISSLNASGDKRFIGFILQSKLSDALSMLVRFPEMENSIVQASLQLYMASIDIFYHSSYDQLALISKYLDSMTCRTLHKSEEPILQLLLQRLTSIDKLEEFLADIKTFEFLNFLLNQSLKWKKIEPNDTGIANDLISLIYSMTQALLWGYQREKINKELAWNYFELILKNGIEISALKIDLKYLETSVLGQICPLLFNTIHHYTWRPVKEIYERFCGLLGELIVHVGRLNQSLGDTTKEIYVESTCTKKTRKEMESPHEYQNNMHLLSELRIPGATSLTITFDSRSRTENGYDYVTFFKDDSQTSYYGEEKYSGRGEEQNWPGVGGNPPLVIDSDGCHVLFHSDGSGVDWGYKFSVVGLVETQQTCLTLPWLSHVEDSLIVLLSLIARDLVRGKVFTPISTTETSHSVLLNSKLLHGGKQVEQDHVVNFLRELIDPVEESHAWNLVNELKKQTVQDQGSIVHMNRAVRAVAAAILHHNLCGMDVVQFSENHQQLTAPVLQAWKAAQKMRQWFDSGDAVEATVHRLATSRPGLKRQPSAYKGASEEAIQKLCEIVTERAFFLLEFTPASFSFVRAAKLRWNLLAKYTTAIHRKNSWLHLVNELNAATELKSLLEYRRTSMERLKAPKSITDLVLEFVQSDIDIVEMQTILSTRSERAVSRIIGIATISKALLSSSLVHSQHYLLENFAASMREIGMEDSCNTNLHFFNSLNGCDELKRKELSEAIASCLHACAQFLQFKTSNHENSMDGALISSALKAIAMDYDVRDSYLLYDSKVLPHILRLLLSENIRIRRAAQSIVRVFLSHFVAIHEDQDDVPNLSLFQKQLIAAVRLQLEGITNSIDEIENKNTIHLARNQPGYCAPSIPLLDTHSIVFWMYVEEPICQYALKIGDEVRRGPHWISTQDEDGGDTGIGIVTIITSPTTVQVKWYNTNQLIVYTWDPSIPLYEIQLVDEGIGGMVFLNGNRNLVSDTDESIPWSHHGIFLTDEGQLKYVINSGKEKDILIESSDSVHLNAWNHISFIKNKNNCKLYLNGILNSEYLYNELNEIKNYKLIESIHPCQGNGDINRFHILFPGALRLIITFDPFTQLEKGDSFSFYTNNNENEIWGNEIHFNNLPGINGNSLFIIPSDETILYFHSITDTLKWGFRLLIVPEYDGKESESFNSFPFYFGEPPGRVLDAPSSHCWISQFSIFNTPLKETEIALHMRQNSQEYTPSSFPIDRTLQTLGLIQTCAETPFGRGFITRSGLIKQILFIAFLGPIETQCGAWHVLVELAPDLTTSVVDEGYARAFPHSELSFLETIWENLGHSLNVWPEDHNSMTCHTILTPQASALSNASLTYAYVALIRTLAKSSEWLDRIYELMLSTLDHKTLPDDLSRTFATIAVLGGTYDGVCIGSRVSCCVNIDGKESIEVGSVIQFRLKGESRMASVLFDCDNSRPVDVPINDISVEELEEDPIAHLWDKEHQQVLLERLEQLLKHWHDVKNQPHASTVRYKPLSTKQNKMETVESEHPYLNNAKNIYTLEFPGAEEIEITFDPKSSTEVDCDYVRFQKRDGSGGYYGEEKYSGVHFPGLGSVQPLVIPASSVDVVFHTESSNTDWGFRIYATAKLETQLDPPESPPSYKLGAWSDLRTRILCAITRHTKLLAPSFPLSLLSEITRTAITPYIGRPLTSMPKSQVFESKHPYANSISEYMAVTFKGADMLSISFDAQSRTEHGCDYVVFFKDKSLTDRWGEHQYTGRAGSDNWPGCGGRPPLLIPSEGFTLLWCTDSSNVDWGWKFIVKATFPSVSPLSLTTTQLNQRSYHATEMLYEQMQYQVSPSKEAFDGFERDVSVSKYQTSVDEMPPLPPNETTTWYRLHSFESIPLYQEPSEKAAMLDVLTPNSHVKVLDEKIDWAYIKTKHGDQGWIKKRKGEVWYIYPLTSSFYDDETILLGIDDIQQIENSVDDYNEEQEELANFTSHFTIEELKGQTRRIHSLVVETYDAFAIKCARQSISTMIATASNAFQPTASTPTELLELVVILLEQNERDQEDALQKKLYHWVHAIPELLGLVVKYAMNALRVTLLELPRNRAVVRSMESSHPYADNTDTYWRVDMPGVRRIKIVFDPRSKTEAGCDWVCFYAANDRTITYGEAQYSGRGGSENWPGYGSRPPLMIEADRFEVYFHTDASGNDWGWAFTAYGIVEECENSGKTCLKKPLQGCWLLQALTSMPQKTDDVLDVLFSLPMHLLWIDCLNEMPQEIKLNILKMITKIALDSNCLISITKQYTRWNQLRFLIKKKMIAQHRSEERQETKSPYFQRLVQCALALDYVLEHGGYSNHPGKLSIQAPLTCEWPYIYEAKAFQSTEFDTMAWEFSIKTCSGLICLGVGEDILKQWQWSNDSSELNCISTKTIFHEGDIVHIECDLVKKRLLFRRNTVFVAETGMDVSPATGIYPIVTLSKATDIVLLSRSIPHAVLLDFPDPNWYVKAIDSMSMLVMENTNDAAVVIRESSHPMSEEPWHDTIQIPNALKLEVRFDRQTQLGPKDVVTMTSPSGYSKILTGLDGKKAPEHGAFGPLERTTSLDAGDLVVRGNDWIYGEEDGGAGESGVVIEVIAWKHRAAGGVKVKWTRTNHENVYRYGYNGHFDVMLASTPPISVLWVDGDTVDLSIVPFRLACAKDSGFHGSLHFNRQTLLVLDHLPHLELCDDFSIQFWLRLADDNIEKRSQTIFFAGDKVDDACIHLSLGSDSKLRFIYKTNEFVDALVTEPWTPSHTWTHFTLTSSGSEVTMYKFGEKWAQHTFYGRATYKTRFESISWGHVHGVVRPGFKNYIGLAGQLYDVQIWNAPLSSNDIRRTLVDKADLLYPPSPSFSPWKTVNQTGKDFMSIRSNLVIKQGQVYFEVKWLSSGTVHVGWVHRSCSLRRKTAGIGDCPQSYAIDVNRQYMWHNGPCAFTSPSTVKANEGDILGCMLDVDRGRMSFTLNGLPIGDTFAAPPSSAPRRRSTLKIAPLLSPKAGGSTPRALSQYEASVAELMDMGCSRQRSVGALEKHNQNVANALEWLLHHPEEKSSPTPVVQEANEVYSNTWQGGLQPAISLSPMGSQGVEWNLGQDPFAHPPEGYSSVWSHSQTDIPVFEVFDWSEDIWETIKVRHRLLDLSPQLLHRYVLNEGEGELVEDVKGATQGRIISSNSPWRASILSPMYNQGISAWGFRVTIFGHFHPSSLPKTRFLQRVRNPSSSHRKSTIQLVQYVNQKQKQFDTTQILRAPWTDFSLKDEDWVRWPLLCEISGGLAISTESMGSEINQNVLAVRFKWLQEFNLAMNRLLPLVLFEKDTSKRSLSSMIRHCRGYIFQILKKGIWEDQLKHTQRSGVALEMTLNRPKAIRHRASNQVDTDARTSLFAQAFRQLNANDNHHFRRSDNIYYVKFLGENAEDAGGPYRETFAQYASELHSSQLPMFLRTPNAAHNVGIGREKWVVNPNAFHSTHLRRRIFLFLGKLMGACVRSKDFFALDLAGLIWKLLVNEERSIDDLEALDKMLVQSMQKMRTIELLGVTEEMFEDIVLETFTTLSTDNKIVEIKENGRSIPVTFKTRIEFANLVEKYRLHEFDQVVGYIQQGIATVLPLNTMELFTALEFEYMVCGSPEVDIDLLVQGTEYSSCAATDQHVIWFWNTLRKFSHEERSTFLRFVWGRSRLPHTLSEFPQWFKLQSFNKGPADRYLPVAHTCFFALELPAYSSEELVGKKLLYAMYNCQEIDADGDHAVNQMGWEE